MYSPLVEPLESRRLLAGNGLAAAYFDNADFSGAAVQRVDPTVNFDWGAGSPATGIAADTFSARWTGQVEATKSETYTFYTLSDDGVRLWVNGQLLINNWTVHAPKEDKGSIALVSGQRYDIKLEYYENLYGAVARLLWSSPSTAKSVIPQAQLYSTALPPTPVVAGTGTGLAATYFDNADLTGVTFLRTDPTINFDWGAGSPAASIAADTFSARWTGQVQAQRTETYTFYTLSDDGVRLWVNGQLLINNWTVHAPREDRGSISLVAGSKYDIKLEYYEQQYGAVAKLMWSSPSTAKAVIPQSQLYPAAVTPVTPTGVLQVSANGRYLLKDNGQPFFYMADTAWQMPVKLTPAEVDVYLKDRAAKGFNVIQVVATDETYWRSNYEGQAPLLNNNPATPNDAFFKFIDSIVAKAASYGIYVAIVPTWGRNVADPAWRIFNTSSAYAYGHYLGARYRNAWNVVWINGGDWAVSDSTTRAIWTALAQGLSDGDQGIHLITFHPRGGQTSGTYWSQTEWWLDINMTQSGHTRDSAAWDLITQAYIRTPAKPVIEGEMNYENIPSGGTGPLLDAYDVRKKAYWETFAGAAGVAYGANEVYQFSTGAGGGISWQTALQLPGAGQMKYLPALLQSRPYLARVPDQSLLVSSNYGGTDHIQATRAADGSYAFVYTASGKAPTVNLDKLSGTTVTASWYDPRTGKLTRIGQYTSTGYRTFAAPSSGYANDWVLVLDDAAAGYGTPQV